MYRGLRPVNWCIECSTALAEAEVEYQDKTSDSIFIRFKLKGPVFDTINGDIDIVAGAQDANEVAWWENDQDDSQQLASGDIEPVSFWGGKVFIDFSESV